jgi:hypothetical protein
MGALLPWEARQPSKGARAVPRAGRGRHYGGGMRVVVGAMLFAMSGALAACSASGTASGTGDGSVKGGHVDTRTACRLLRQLDQDGKTVAHADVGDPAAFSASLDTAVKRYTATLDQLRLVVPSNLLPSIDRLHAAVDQYRFTDGVDAHATLSAYRARSCH